MYFTRKLVKLGNSYAVTIPPVVVEMKDLRLGDDVLVDIKPKKLQAQKKRRCKNG
jgi:antitoxin component of MazEF toxin-antitoxin module